MPGLPRILLTTCAVAAACVPWTARAADRVLVARPAAEAERANLPEPGTDAFLGVVTTRAARGLSVVRVVEGAAAQRAGLAAGDLLTLLDGRALRTEDDLVAALARHAPGDTVAVTLERDAALLDRTVRLGGRRAPQPYHRGALFRLLVVPLRFADDRDDGVARTALERFYFARTGTSGAGASLADYFADQSGGALRVEGAVAEAVRLDAPRGAYDRAGMGGGRDSPFAAAAQALAARDGADALRSFDGIAFVYDGAVEAVPGRALWPHRAVVTLGGRRLPYYVHSADCAVGGEIGEHCHEFGHLLGLPDMYGAAHRTGAGDFCLMAIGHRGAAPEGARAPFSLCAWCRVQLGWLPTVVVDPRTPQRLRLAPVGTRGAHAVVVPLTPRSDEYLLLAARERRGFDARLPSAGLFVWRVGGAGTPGQGRYRARVDLVEAHGVDTFDAALVRPGEIAFPTARARDLTPDTQPSTRSAAPGAFRVDLTDIERAADGSVCVTLGVPRDVRQAAPEPYDAGGREPGGYPRLDPVTGERVLLDPSPAGSGAAQPVDAGEGR